MTPPRGIVWDLGNVLIDWQPHAAIAAGVGAEEANRFLGAEDFDFMGYNHGPDGGMTWAEAEAAVADSHPHWLSHARAYREHFPRSLVGEVPGSVDILRALHAADVPMWGLTNWSHELYPNAPAMFDFLGLLQGVVVSGTEGIAKPDPRIFELTAARAGHSPEYLIFIDDRADNVVASCAVGMDGIRFTDAAQLRRDLRDRGLPA
ncbi:HAD family phosphatase [Nocardioides salsibiostraticola]